MQQIRLKSPSIKPNNVETVVPQYFVGGPKRCHKLHINQVSSLTEFCLHKTSCFFPPRWFQMINGGNAEFTIQGPLIPFVNHPYLAPRYTKNLGGTTSSSPNKCYLDSRSLWTLYGCHVDQYIGWCMVL